MDDAALVAAARTGDRDAWGLIYDRYADRLHDHCWSILRDEHEAGDALHDAFVKAAGAIAQLRDPSRLRPWLYAIARNEAFRRHRARSRAVPMADLGDEGEVGTVTFDLDTDPHAPVDDLRKLVWDAAGGLSEDDKALLDLHLRQGLEGEDLAEAMGITANNAYVKLSRLRDTLERSLGALVVARTGSRDCDELQALLDGWDGAMSPLLRKRIARHIDGCETCGERKRKMVSPLALLAGVPVLPAPAALRDRILDDATRISAANAPSGPAAPPPVPPPVAPPVPATSSSPWGWVLGAVAAAVLVVAFLLIALGDGDGDDIATTDDSTTTTEAPVVTTSSTSTSSTSTSTTSTSTTSTTVVAPAAIELTTNDIDLGDDLSDASFQIRNTGGTAAAFTVTSSNPAVLAVSPAAETLQPGQRRTIFVTLDRTSSREGTFTHTVTVAAAEAGSDQVTVRGTVLRPPVIAGLTSERSTIHTTSCPASLPRTSTITASFTDESAVTAQLFWAGDPGSSHDSGNTPMVVSGGTATGTLGPFDFADPTTPLRYWVVITDAFDNVAESAHQPIVVNVCPG